MNSRKWDTGTLEYIIAQWRTGRKSSDIAEELNVPHAAMLNAVERYRPYARKETRQENVEKAADLWNNSASMERICEELGLKKRSVYYLISRYPDLFERRRAKHDHQS